MVDFSANVTGVDSAIKAMMAAFPKDLKIQQRLVNGAMRISARKNLLPIAKQNASRGDGSGALSEALVVRSMSAKRKRELGVPFGIQILPYRFNKKALALYIEYYYTRQGKRAAAKDFARGIRHGHFVEFGNVNNTARPFLRPAADEGQQAYLNGFSQELRKGIEKAVEKARKR